MTYSTKNADCLVAPKVVSTDLALEPHRRSIARILVRPESQLHYHQRLVSDLHLAELTLFLLVATLQLDHEHFEIPAQMDINDLTVRDLCYLIETMGPDHHDTTTGV